MANPREIDFYRQQCNDLGKRILQLQRENTSVLRDRKRSRVLAHLIGLAHRELLKTISIDEAHQTFLKILISTLNVDRAILLNYSPDRCRLEPISYLGVETGALSSTAIPNVPEEFYFANSKSTIDPTLELFRKIAGLPYFLWSFDRHNNIALLIANQIEDQHLHPPFEKNDQEIIAGALDVLLDITERIKAQERLHQRDTILEALSFSAQQFLNDPCWQNYIEDILRRIGEAVVVDHVYIFRDHENSKPIPHRYEWRAATEAGRHFNSKNEYSFLEIFHKAGWMDQLRKGKTIWGNRSDFTEDIGLILSLVDIHSIFITPIFVNENLWGWLGFSDYKVYHQWPGTIREALKLAAGNFGALIHRNQIEHSLRDSEEKYRLIAENISDVVWTTDNNLKPTYVSPSIEYVLGYTPEEAIGTPLEKIVTAESYKKALKAIKKLEKHHESEINQPITLEIEMINHSGLMVPCEVTNLPLMDDDNRPIGFIGVTRDITDRKKFEKQILMAKKFAERANQTKSEFLANMSHELRTPLNHIIGFTELVMGEQFGELNSTQKEYLADALTGGRHLLALINDILDLSKVEAGKMELQNEPIDLSQLIKNSLNMVKEKTLKHGVKISLDLTKLPRIIQGDGLRLKQIMYNLLSNAVKFTPDKGTLQIIGSKIRPKNGCLHTRDGRKIKLNSGGHENPCSIRSFAKVAVCDTGIGLLPADIDRIFGSFNQVETTANRRFQGTGLGLALTKKFVEMHGGAIWAESDGPNCGSTFSFVIPISNP